MEKRQRVGKAGIAKSTQDVDRNFIIIPDVTPEQWRDDLDLFFDEKEAGQDHMRRLMDISKTDIDHYYFAGGYDWSEVHLKRSDVAGSKTSMTPIARLGGVIPVYESAGCFRYAMP